MRDEQREDLGTSERQVDVRIPQSRDEILPRASTTCASGGMGAAPLAPIDAMRPSRTRTVMPARVAPVFTSMSVTPVIASGTPRSESVLGARGAQARARASTGTVRRRNGDLSIRAAPSSRTR